MRAPLSHFLRAVDYVMGAVAALVTVALMAASAALTGLPRRHELGRAYAGLLMQIEASARELRADYCARADVEFASSATCAGLTSLLRKRPAATLVALLGVSFSAVAMSVTGGAPSSYEIREARAAIARLLGHDAGAEAVEARNRIRPAAWHSPPEIAAQPADVELASLGGDLLGGPEEDMLGSPAP